MAARHHESSAWIAAPPEQVFAFVDDHARFSAHMNESSWMMGGGRMVVEVDAAKGQAVGSHIRLSGKVWGLRLYLDEVVTGREPPTHKVWETVGSPTLLVIGSYRVGVEIARSNGGSRLGVFIDYDLPTRTITYWLGLWFGGIYARWCVSQMLAAASTHFGKARTKAAA